MKEYKKYKVIQNNYYKNQNKHIHQEWQLYKCKDKN